MRRLPHLVAILLPLLAIACGDSGGGTSPEVLSVRLSPSQATLDALGDTVRFTARVVNSKGETVSGRAFSWSSSNTDVATISGGLVTAASNGQSTITATSQDISGTATATVDQVATSAVVTTGDGQTGTVGTALSEAVAVELRDSRDNLIVGEAVSFQVTAGGGSVDPSNATTDDQGIASTTWTLGTDASLDHMLTATSGSAEATVTADAEAADPAVVVLLAGDGQEGLARETLAQPLEVRVEDEFTNPVPMAQVAWQITQGGGTITGENAGADGVATATWTLGPVQGDGLAVAQSGEATGAEFSATILPNGVIEGVISASNAFLSPEVLATTVLRTGPTRSNETTSLFDRRSRGVRPLAAEPGLEPQSLGWVVHFDSEALGAPSRGASAYRFEEVSTAVSARIRNRLAPVAGEVGVQIAGTSPAILAARVHVPGDDPQILRRIQQLPGVAEVEEIILIPPLNPLPIRTERVLRGRDPRPLGVEADEPWFPRQAWHYDLAGVFGAWELTTGSSDVVVAVVDDGIRFDHPDIGPNLTSDGYDFVSDDPRPICSGGSTTRSRDGDGYDPDPTIPDHVEWDSENQCAVSLLPTGGHGLHVAGTIAAVGNNGIGGTGIAWNARIRPVRVLGVGGGVDYDIAQGILYAAGLPADDGNGGTVQTTRADIINMSLGGPGSSSILENAVQLASQEGVLLIAAAGNSGIFEAHYPASYPEVVSVASVNAAFERASYSTAHSTVEIAAPGGEVAWGDAHGVYSTYWDFQNTEPMYYSANGTSMAAPHVSGVAALILSGESGLSGDQVRARLTDYALDLGPTGRDDEYGYGLVRAEASLREGQFPPRDTYAHLVNQSTGAVLETQLTGVDGSYSFGALDDGSYRIYTGEDIGGDGQTGVLERRWGAYGGSSAPSSITVEQSSIHTADFSYGWPWEVEPNDAISSAVPILLGGYTYGEISSASQVDVFQLDVPEQATVIIETGPFYGACGLAFQGDFELRLLDANGNLLASNDATDRPSLRLCDRIEQTLDAGTYYLELRPLNVLGYYGIQVRRQ